MAVLAPLTVTLVVLLGGVKAAVGGEVPVAADVNPTADSYVDQELSHVDQEFCPH